MRTGKRSVRRCCSLLALLALAGCSPNYPLDKPGTWSLEQSGSANDANLHAMVANPLDLVAGRGESGSLGAEAGRPVELLLSGKRQSLPSTDTLDVNLPSSSQSPGGGSAGQ